MKKLVYVLVVLSLMFLSIGPNPVHALDNIEIQSVNSPSVVAPGQTFCFNVTVKVNQGQLVESRGDMLRNTDNNLYGHWPHIAVAGTVNTGQSFTFNCYGSGMTAPSTEGTYESKWRVWRNGAWDGREFAIRFEVRNGGGGGGGGGSVPDVQCPDNIGAVVEVEEFHRSYIDTEGRLVEHAAEVNIESCPVDGVKLNITQDGFEIQTLTGLLTLDDNYNLTSLAMSVIKLPAGPTAGVLAENTSFAGMPYIGFKATQSAKDPAHLFAVEVEHEVRYISKVYQPNYNYAYINLPAIRAYVVETLARARFDPIITSSHYLLLLGVVVAWYAPAILLLSHSSTAHTSELNAPVYVNAEITPLFKQQYGTMINWGDLSDLEPTRDVVSAYTEFSVKGSGFSPNGQVYYEFGLPNTQEPLIRDVVVADQDGNVTINITMPEPSTVPLGTYLLAAFDNFTIEQTRQEAFNENLDPPHFIAGVAKIEVVKDVTPPTITIASPAATSYSRCDVPIVSYNVTDDLSGVASVEALLDQSSIVNNTKLNMLFWRLGTHSIDIQAFDKVGWEQNQHLEFQLVASIKGTKCALDRFQELQMFSTNGAYTSINVLLTSADKALANNKIEVARNHLNAIQKVLTAQKKQINPNAYIILLMDINVLVKEPIR